MKRTAQHYMRASEDKKPDPTAKDMQGLAVQMAPNQLNSPQGKPANPKDYDIVRKPQSPPAPNPLFQQPKGAPFNGEKPNTWNEQNNASNIHFSPDQKEGWGVSGKLSYGRERPKDGPTEASAELGVSTNNALQEKLEDEEEKKKKISPNGNGEEQEPNPNR